MGRSRVALHMCVPRDVPGALALCGVHVVYENRALQSGRPVPLEIVILPATGPHPQPDVIVPLNGGPGLGAATEAGIAGFVRGAWPTHDILLVDQRGTGQSNPLNCQLFGDGQHASAYLGSRLPAARVPACRAALARHADLTQYTTPIAADDLDEVLTALGYDRADIAGFSYGGRAALVFLRRHPSRVRSVVVAWGVGPEVTIPLSMASAAQHALTAVLDDCSHNASCHAAYPHAASELDSVLARLARAPARVSLRERWYGTPDTATLTQLGFAESILELLYGATHARRVPYWVHRVYEGDMAAFATEVARTHRTRWSRNANGLLLSVLCAEDAPYIDSASVARAMAEQPIGVPLLPDLVAACATWPRASLPPDEHQPVSSDAPVLLISGARDPTGSADWAATAHQHLPNSIDVVFPYYGHGDANACTLDLIAAFIARPEPSALHVDCAAQITPPLFLVATSAAR